MGRRFPRTDRNALARRDRAGHGHQRDHLAHEDMFSDAGRGGRQTRREGGSAEGQERRRAKLQGPPRLVQPASRTTGEEAEWPRQEFLYWTDDGSGAAPCGTTTGRSHSCVRMPTACMSGRRRTSNCVCRWLATCAMDPFERAHHEAIGYGRWQFDHMYVFAPAGYYVGQWLQSFREFPAAPEARQFQPRPCDGIDNQRCGRQVTPGRPRLTGVPAARKRRRDGRPSDTRGVEMTTAGQRAVAGSTLTLLLAACGSPDHHETHWGYDGEGAPEHWASLSPDFATCDAGVEQSPIDLANAVPIEDSGIARRLGEAVISVEQRAHVMDLIDNGHTVQVNERCTTSHGDWGNRVRTCTVSTFMRLPSIR